MQYDFDRVVSRAKNFSAKYDERVKNFGTDQVIPLWIADMDFPTAQPIIDAAVRRAQEGIWGYTSRPKSYFEAVCAWQQRRHSWSPDPALCSHALGVVPALAALVRLFTEPDEKVLIQPPVYGEFAEVTEFQGRELVRNPLIETAPGKWEVDWADLERKLQEAKLFLFCSPHNPLGIVWSREDLMRMMELCRKYGVLVVSDEIHADLVFRGTHIPTASLSPEIATNTITCISGTKTFNLAGLHASTTVFPNLEMKSALTISGCPSTSTATTLSAWWPWRRPSGRVTSGSTSFFRISTGTSIISRNTWMSTFPRSRPFSPTPPISCGWTAAPWGFPRTPWRIS